MTIRPGVTPGSGRRKGKNLKPYNRYNTGIITVFYLLSVEEKQDTDVRRLDITNYCIA